MSKGVNRNRVWSQVLLEMHQATDLSALAEVTAQGLARCVYCDGALLTLALDPVAGDFRFFGSLAGVASRAIGGIDARTSEQNPIYLDRLRLRLHAPTTLDRLDDTRGVRRTDFADQVLRPLRARRLLQAPNIGTFPATMMLVRSAGDDFDAHDIERVRSIGEHLTLAMTKLRDPATLLARLDGRPTTLMRQLWIVTDRTGRILRAQPEALTLLRDCMRGPAIHDRLPASMTAALVRRLRGGPREVMQFQLPGRLVSVYLAPIRPVADECTCTLIEQPLAVAPADRFISMGLTPRESEILHWMCEGKTNAEIGTILGISPLTAKKHVENILHKLSVETRTTAVARALGA